jgi:serine/threonine-protein kinase
VPGAIAAYRTAIACDPKYAKAHNNLGNALHARKDLPGAITAYRTAIACDPKYAKAHYNLGLALHHQGDLAGAAAAYRQALAHDPELPEAHCNLGAVLLSQGQFSEARKPSRAGLDLLPAGDPRRSAFSRQLQRCEAFLALDEKLPAVLRGSQKPGSAVEALELAWLCRQLYTRLYRASARLYGDAFAAEPKLADDLRTPHRYDAARAAALAAAGQGQDAGKLDDSERSRLRAQALDWLRADLEACARLTEQGDKDARRTVHQRLTPWLADAELASVREPQALQELPPDEQAAWRRLWADVDALRGRLARREAFAAPEPGRS